MQKLLDQRLSTYCGIGILVLFGFSALFSTHSFLHPESVVAAYWWTKKGSSFWVTLFDPYLMDQAPGRFRFVSYLMEGIYWRLNTLSLFPKTFCDLLAVGVALLIAWQLWGIAKEKKLSLQSRVLLLALYLSSSPVYFSFHWHNRVGKYLVSLFLVLTYRWLNQEENDIIKNRVKIILTFLSGFFTDPLYLLMAPILFLAKFLSSRSLWKQILSTFVICLGLSGVFLVLLNGIIGPLINHKTQLILNQVIDKPEIYFSLANLLTAHQIVADLLAPLLIPQSFWLGLGIMFVLVSVYFFVNLVKEESTGFPLLSLGWMSLLIAAFAVRPSAAIARHGMYYGYPIFLLGELTLIEVIARTKTNKLSHFLISLAIVGTIFSHLYTREQLLEAWSKGALPSAITQQLYLQDAHALEELKREKRSVKEPLEGSESYYSHAKAYYDEGVVLENRLPHHDLGYVITPLWFGHQ